MYTIICLSVLHDPEDLPPLPQPTEVAVNCFMINTHGITALFGKVYRTIFTSKRRRLIFKTGGHYVHSKITQKEHD